MIRAFIAIDLPDLVLEQCRRISERLRGLGLEARFTQPESIHLTLKFLGNIEQHQIPNIVDVLTATSRSYDPFKLRVGGVGVFPKLGNPRVVWVGIEVQPTLGEVQQNIEKGTESLGFSRELRDFHPHLTVARLKTRKNLDLLAGYVQGDGESEEAGTFIVEAIHLYLSELNPAGAKYRQLATAPLAAISHRWDLKRPPCLV